MPSFSRPALRRQSIALGAMFFFKIIADSQLTVLATSVLGQAKGIDLTSALWTIFFGNGVAVLGYLLSAGSATGSAGARR